MTVPADRPRARWRSLGISPGIGRLAAIQALHSAGESMFAISLAGSLFFSVSIDASRSRILLYLALTLAPFAVLGTLIGPFLDRAPGGHRVVIITTFIGRGLLVLLLAGRVQGLWLYPLAFGILVLARTYSITRNTIVPSLVQANDQLVRANASLAMMSVLSGTVASATGAAILALADSGWVLHVATVPYLLAAMGAIALPRVDATPHDDVHDIVEIVDPAIRASAGAMATLRMAVGFLTFHMAFALKEAGEPAWFFGVMLVAHSAGGFLGTLMSPILRSRNTEHRMLTGALVTPAFFAAIAALRFHRITIVALAFVLGAGASVGRRAFDSVVQTHAPHGSRGSAYAILETQMEVSWVSGALAAVVARATDWLGVGVLSIGLAAVSAVRFGIGRLQSQLDQLMRQQPLPRRLFINAEELAARGQDRMAVIMIGAATEAASIHPQTPHEIRESDEVCALLEKVAAFRRDAIAGVEVDLDAALEAGGAVVARLGFDGNGGSRAPA